MTDINASLKKTINNEPGPQYKEKGKAEFNFAEGEDGVPYTYDKKVESRLTAIENKLDSVIENGSVNTQLTGSNVEDAIPTKFTSRNILFYAGGNQTLSVGESFFVGERYDRPETTLPLLSVSFRAGTYDNTDNYSVRIASFNDKNILRETFDEVLELNKSQPTARTFIEGFGESKNNFIQVQIKNESENEITISEIVCREGLFR